VLFRVLVPVVGLKADAAYLATHTSTVIAVWLRPGVVGALIRASVFQVPHCKCYINRVILRVNRGSLIPHLPARPVGSTTYGMCANTTYYQFHSSSTDNTCKYCAGAVLNSTVRDDTVSPLNTYVTLNTL
jgi:hypothetical protein